VSTVEAPSSDHKTSFDGWTYMNHTKKKERGFLITRIRSSALSPTPLAKKLIEHKIYEGKIVLYAEDHQLPY
jgi:hypothetical protein